MRDRCCCHLYCRLQTVPTGGWVALPLQQATCGAVVLQVVFRHVWVVVLHRVLSNLIYCVPCWIVLHTGVEPRATNSAWLCVHDHGRP